MSNLKSCPFCGSNTTPQVMTADEISLETSGGPDLAVCCRLDKGGCGATGCYALDAKKAIANWNRRAPQ